MWCGSCYLRQESDRFHINEPLDEEGHPVYEDASEALRYRIGIDGGHLMSPFQCDTCIFRTLFKRDHRNILGDIENLAIIRRMNLDVLWSREPSTIKANMRSVAKLISSCESAGFKPELPSLGPLPFEDKYGFCVAFGMLMHSRQKGRHSKEYTQYATIRKQRSAYSNLYAISNEALLEESVLAILSQPQSTITSCPTSSLWFMRWSAGCEIRMGFILKQNMGISIDVLMTMIKRFAQEIKALDPTSWERKRAIMGLAYSVISFSASLRGSEGLKLHWDTLVRLFERGSQSDKSHTGKVPHVVIPLMGRFKGEAGERCHLIPLSNKSTSGIPIRESVKMLITCRNQELSNRSSWAFTGKDGLKLRFNEMNEIILECLERVKDEDELNNLLGLRNKTIREDFSINRSFRRGSSTYAQNKKIPRHVIDVHNRWRKIERAKGKKARMAMIENYSEIEQLIPTLVRYSEML